MGKEDFSDYFDELKRKDIQRFVAMENQIFRLIQRYPLGLTTIKEQVQDDRKKYVLVRRFRHSDDIKSNMNLVGGVGGGDICLSRHDDRSQLVEEAGEELPDVFNTIKTDTDLRVSLHMDHMSDEAAVSSFKMGLVHPADFDTVYYFEDDGSYHKHSQIPPELVQPDHSILFHMEADDNPVVDSRMDEGEFEIIYPLLAFLRQSLLEHLRERKRKSFRLVK